MSTQPEPARDHRDDADAHIDELVFECLERLEREGWVAVDELCREYPDYATLLRVRVEALRACGWLERELRGRRP